MRYVIRLEYNRKKLTVFDTMNPSQEFALIDPSLHMERDNAGSFEATFPITNTAVLHNTEDTPWFSKFITRVVIYYTKDNQEFKILWRGRLFSLDSDFYGQLHTYFEGDLAMLNDTLMFPITYHYDPSAASTGTYVGGPNNQRSFSSNTYPITDILNVHNDRLQMKNLSKSGDAEDYDGMQDQRMWYIPLNDERDATYSLLTSEPEDWETNYTHYFTQEKTKYQTVYKAIPEQTTVPTFEVSKYYAQQPSGRTKGIPDDIFSQGDLVTEDETALSSLQKIVDNYGGHYRVLYDTYTELTPGTGVLYGKEVERSRLQWVEMPKEYDPDTPVTQYIAFGENLIDFTRKTEIKDFVSCIRPRGKKLHSAGATALGVNYRVASMPGTYTKLNSKPDDWETNFWTYFEKRRDVYCPLFKSYKAPKFEDGDYYSAELNPDEPIVKTREGVGGGITWNSLGCARDVWIKQNNTSSGTLEMDKYVWDMSSYYMVTGYWASTDGKSYPHEPKYDNTFVAYPGEKYYVLATGGYDGVNRNVVSLFTDGTFRNFVDNGGGNYTWYFTPISGTQTSNVKSDPDHASYDRDDLSGRSGLVYQLVTIPDYRWGNGINLNICARSHYGASAPTKYYELHMDIWGTRTVNAYEDEYITLCGINDGTWSTYMGTITKEEDEINSPRKMQNSLEHDSENIPIFVEPATVDGTNFDGYFMYPMTDHEPDAYGYYDGKSQFPMASSANVGRYVCDISTGDIYMCISSSQGYTYVLRNEKRLYYKKADAIYDVKLVKDYGVVETIVEYNDVDDPEKLKRLACEYLYASIFEKMSIDITALDLALLDNNIDVPRIMDPIHIVSPYHGVDMILPLQSMDIPFNNLENQTFDIGYEKEQKITDRQKVRNIKKG